MLKSLALWYLSITQSDIFCEYNSLGLSYENILFTLCVGHIQGNQMRKKMLTNAFPGLFWGC